MRLGVGVGVGVRVRVQIFFQFPEIRVQKTTPDFDANSPQPQNRHLAPKIEQIVTKNRMKIVTKNRMRKSRHLQNSG